MADFKILPTVNGAAVALASHTHGAGGLAYTPAVWFDTSQLPGIADGATVTTWPDASGNGRDATQATAGFRPTFRADVLNGRPVVRFDTTDDYLATAALSLPQPNTVVVVTRLPLLGGGNRFILDGPGHLLYYDGSQWRMHAGAGVSGGAPTVAPHVFSALYSGASSTLRVDGVQVIAADVGASTLTGITLGSSASVFGGEIAEFLVYNRALTVPEQTQLETALSIKYGIPSALSPFATAMRWGTD